MLEGGFVGAIASAEMSAKATALASRIPTSSFKAKAVAARKAAASADAALTALFAAKVHSVPRVMPMMPEDVLAADLADLDREEAGNSSGVRPFLPPSVSDLSPEARTHRGVVRFLPPELAEFLDRMNAQRRAEREKAILEKARRKGEEKATADVAALAA